MDSYEENRKDYKKEIHLSKDTMVMDRYQIIEFIDRGGFCYTYKVMDTRLNIEVALKEFFPHGVASRIDGDTVTVFTDSDEMDFEKGKNRFLREARGLARFNQVTGIVSVYDYFEYNSTAYIVMEYLKGKNLKKYMADLQGKLSNDFIYDTAKKMCDVLKVIHAHNVIHRDISPDNIFLCEDGTLKLIDFGALNQDYNRDNSTVTVILKQGYAPFEQYYDDGLQGPWTDIYALGATLYNLCTGRVPQQSVARFNQNNLIPPHELNPNISKNFSMAIMKAMSLRIEDRYQSAEEFEHALFDKTEHPDEYYSAAEDAKAEPEKEQHTFAAMDELEDSGETYALFAHREKKTDSGEKSEQSIDVNNINSKNQENKVSTSENVVNEKKETTSNRTHTNLTLAGEDKRTDVKTHVQVNMGNESITSNPYYFTSNIKENNSVYSRDRVDIKDYGTEKSFWKQIISNNYFSYAVIIVGISAVIFLFGFMLYTSVADNKARVTKKIVKEDIDGMFAVDNNDLFLFDETYFNKSYSEINDCLSAMQIGEMTFYSDKEVKQYYIYYENGDISFEFKDDKLVAISYCDYQQKRLMASLIDTLANRYGLYYTYWYNDDGHKIQCEWEIDGSNQYNQSDEKVFYYLYEGEGGLCQLYRNFD